MDENRRRIYQYLEQITEEIEETIALSSNVFYYLQQTVRRHTALETAELNAQDCRMTSQASTTLMNQLQEHRKVIDELTVLYEMTVCEARTYYHTTLLDRLETDIECKIKDLLDNVLHQVLLFDIYQEELAFRHSLLKLTKWE
ncbi:hypothetical protein CDAR_309451 [Caerostris darwini]|uniref:Uncharacterized protein n=1 Tax=Caerostris darwini TaxID=1538125 RepID=A0AAV4SCI0_9ARAC|nr:hypothetical protein CDAR_309451 [Caerostris darwini]